MESEVGKVYGDLTVLSFVGKFGYSNDNYLRRCSCGKELPRSIYKLRTGHTKTCGCGGATYSIYKEYPEELVVYNSIVKRCKYYNPTSHKSYFDKGVTLCDEWAETPLQGFTNFVKDMGRRPSKDHEIDRIDNDLGYSPSNCRWVHRAVNALNKGCTSYLKLDGAKYPLRFVLRYFGVDYSTFRDRFLNNLPVELLFTKGTIRSNPQYRALVAEGLIFTKKRECLPKEMDFSASVFLKMFAKDIEEAWIAFVNQ